MDTFAEADFEKFIEDVCQDLKILGVVACASNASGTFEYRRTFGSRTMSDSGQPGEPMTEDAVLSIASCTKLLTTICALQCVERGQVALDDDMTEILPELADWQIITGVDADGTPQLTPKTNRITLRRLLTHTAGLSYPAVSPLIQSYNAYHRLPLAPDGPTVATSMTGQLTYEPGTRWEYSPGLDWAGVAVERLCGTSLEAYIAVHVYGAVAAHGLTWFPDRDAQTLARTATMTSRGRGVDWSAPPPDSEEHVTRDAGPAWDPQRQGCFGGQGAFSSMPEYAKVLRNLLADDGRVLGSAMLAEMMRGQLEPQAKASFEALRGGYLWEYFPGQYPSDGEYDFGLACLITKEEMPGWRGKGMVNWSGLPNLFWFVDREHDLCGIIGMQVKPPGDKLAGRVITAFEKGVRGRYAEYKRQKDAT